MGTFFLYSYFMYKTFRMLCLSACREQKRALDRLNLEYRHGCQELNPGPPEGRLLSTERLTHLRKLKPHKNIGSSKQLSMWMNFKNMLRSQTCTYTHKKKSHDFIMWNVGKSVNSESLVVGRHQRRRHLWQHHWWRVFKKMGKIRWCGNDRTTLWTY